MIFTITSLNPNTVFADTTEWNSEILVGILESENTENGINVKVSTISNNGLKIEWSEPNLTENLLVTGYQILRKTLDNNYSVLVENTKSLETSYIDDGLVSNYYGYKILPITVNMPSDQITLHGIDRNNNLFASYLAGQELIAQQTLEKILNTKTIQNNSLEKPKTHHYEFLKRSEDPVLQHNISIELLKAEKIFSQYFNVQINH